MATSSSGVSADQLLEGEIDGSLDEDYVLDPVEEKCGPCGEYTPHQVRLPKAEVTAGRGQQPKEVRYRLSTCTECGSSSYDQVRNL